MKKESIFSEYLQSTLSFNKIFISLYKKFHDDFSTVHNFEYEF